MAEPAIRAARVSFAYPGGPAVLREVSFAVARGERVGVVGANGAGKSTLLLLLAGVMLPDGGTLEVEGVVSARKTLDDIRQRAGLVFQNPDDMFFMPTVHGDIAFGPEHRGLGGEELAGRVARALAAAGASDLAHRAPWTLSGGEKRAVSIAAILALEPAIVLLDEPSSGLDPASRRQLIRQVPRLPGTVIIATHDLDLVLDVCDRAVVLGDGRVAADGASGVILRDRDLLAVNRLELPLRLQACQACSRGEPMR